MAKLIYISQSAANAKKTDGTSLLGNNWNNSSNLYYRSLVFTNDGHLLTHGLDIGGSTVTLNGTLTASPSFYAPTGPGSSGQILKSNGTGNAPSWISLVDDLTSRPEAGTVPDARTVYDLVTSVNAMVYCGLIPEAGAPEADNYYTPAANKGDTYAVSKDCTIDGVLCSAGDLIICNTDSTALATQSNLTTIRQKWDFIHTSLSTELTRTNLYNGNDSGLTRYVRLDNNNYLKVELILRAISINGLDTTNYTANSNTKLDFKTVTNNGIQITEDETSGSEGIKFELLKATNDILGGVKFYSIPYDKTFGITTVSGTEATATYNSSTASGTTQYIINKLTTTKGRFYQVVSDKNGKLCVNVPWENTETANTWRPILAYNLDNTVNNTLSGTPETTGTKTLAFGSEFAYAENDSTINSGSVSEIHLVWCDIDSNGDTNYYV